jgi:hypothetical protein
VPQALVDRPWQVVLWGGLLLAAIGGVIVVDANAKDPR